MRWVTLAALPWLLAAPSASADTVVAELPIEIRLCEPVAGATSYQWRDEELGVVFATTAEPVVRIVDAEIGKPLTVSAAASDGTQTTVFGEPSDTIIPCRGPSHDCNGDQVVDGADHPSFRSAHARGAYSCASDPNGVSRCGCP